MRSNLSKQKRYVFVNLLSSSASSRLKVQMQKQLLIRPDPRVADVLTHNPYPLPNAVAELIDNSFDANASKVLVRFVRNEQRVVAIQVIDNGDGIKPGDFNKAMTFGYRNPHKAKDIGMYGVGLKTASLSQADELRVISKVSNSAIAGRQWLRKNLNKSLLDVMTSKQLKSAFNEVLESGSVVDISGHGTIIEWGKVHDLERSAGDPEKYLKLEMQDVESHMGLVFHRLLESGKAEIYLDVAQDGKVVGGAIKVRPLNPFNYPISGDKSYPKKFTVKIPSSNIKVDAVAHIWPPRTKLREYKIPRVGGRTNTIDSQGLYFYFNDRLVMPGGWANVRTAEAHFSLARMAIDLTADAMKVLVIGYSKDNVRIPSSFINALRSSTARDGTSFAAWVDRAQEVFRTPAPGGAKIPALPQPKSGLLTSVRNAFAEANSPKGNDIELVWRDLSTKMVFKVDRRRDQLVINSRFRKLIIDGGIGRRDGGLFKAVLFLALRDHFGSRSGSKLKAIEDEYQKILLATLGK